MGIRRIYKVGSPYNAEELPELDSVQSFDVMYLAHLNHSPTKLIRAGHADWSFATVTFGPTIGPPTLAGSSASTPNTDADNGGNAYFPEPAKYVVTTIDEATGQESRASDPVELTNDLSLKRNYNTIAWGAVTGAARYRVYKADNTGAYGFIGETEELTFRDNFIDSDLTVGPPQLYNPFLTADDNPSTVTFFEQRLWWARTYNNPNALYSSRSADFENMDTSIPLRADDAISIRLVAQGVNQVNQLVPMDALLAFSSDGIFKIEGSNEDYLSAAPPPRQRRQSGRGCSRLSPIVIDSISLYKTNNSSDIRAAGYSFEIDGVKSDNVSIFSPDLFEGFNIVSWCHAEEPLSIVWAARSDGMLLAFTWEREQQVWGWTTCPLPNDGKVKSLCCIQEQTIDGEGVILSESRVYAIIEYVIAGEPKLFRCRMASGRWNGVAYACHLDASVTKQFEEPSSVVGGLYHLEGETVSAWCDGLVIDDLVVTDGQVTLPEGYAGSVITVGLPYDAVAETLPLFLPTNRTNAGRVHVAGKVHVSLVQSRPPRVGIRRDGEADVPENRMRPIKSGYTGAASDDASLLNGIYPVDVDAVVSGEAKALLKHRVGPLTVSAIYLDTTVTGS